MIDVDSAEVEYAGHAVAVANRETARVDLGIADQAGVEDAEHVVVGGVMKCLAEREAVQQRQQFARLAAADVRLRGEAVLRDARQAAERAHRVLADHRLERERVAVDVERAEGARAVDRVAARRDHDFGKLFPVRREPHFDVCHSGCNGETRTDRGFKARRFHAQACSRRPAPARWQNARPALDQSEAPSGMS